MDSYSQYASVSDIYQMLPSIKQALPTNELTNIEHFTFGAPYADTINEVPPVKPAIDAKINENSLTTGTADSVPLIKAPATINGSSYSLEKKQDLTDVNPSIAESFEINSEVKSNSLLYILLILIFIGIIAFFITRH